MNGRANGYAPSHVRVLISHPSQRLLDRMGDALADAGLDPIPSSGGVDVGLALVRQHAPEVALVCDHGLARAITQDPDLLGTTVVLLADLDLPAVREALRLGAFDILNESCTDGELMARVLAAGKVSELRGRLLGREEQLEGLAFGDELTGLWNRRYLDRRLASTLRSARRHDRGLVVALIDVDRFKDVNDRLGHAVGDEVLVAIGRRLSSAVRDEDVLGRWGGEEFLVILPDLDPQDGHAAAERLRRCVDDRPLTSRRIDVTVSIGWAEDRGGSADELIARADAALYEAKRAGRNRVAQGAPPAAVVSG